MTQEEREQKILELKKKIEQTKAEYDRAKAMQLALKLVINGTYGAFAHPKFVLSNSHIANAITAMGRDVINYMLNKIEKYFYEEWHLDVESHKKLGEEYVGSKDGKYFLLNKNFENIHYSFKDFSELREKLNAFDFKPIEKVEKNGFIVEAKRVLFEPSEIKPIPKDEPIIIYGDTDSLYVSFTPIMKSCDYRGDELDFILHLDRVIVKSIFKTYLEEYAGKFGVKNLHDFELETINRSALHIQKKHYINNVAWEDGIFYDNLSYFYPKGVEIVKSSTPLFVRENIYDFLRYIFDNPNNLDIRKILQIVKDMKKQFMMANIEDISMTTSCTNYGQKVLDDVTDVVCVKGAHFSIKAAAFHNYLLNKNSEFKVKYDNIRGGRIKYYYCLHPKNEVFGYMRSMHPTEITEKEGVGVDYDTQFEKTFLSIVNRFLEPIGLPTINKRLSVLNSLFQI